MNGRRVEDIEKILNLILIVILFCTIIFMLFTPLANSRKSIISTLLKTPSINIKTESPPPKEFKSYSPPIVSLPALTQIKVSRMRIESQSPQRRCIEGDCMNGRGAMILPDGSSYSGLWKNGKPHAKGIYKWSNGSAYSGDIFENRRHGIGRYILADGSEYFGTWKGGMKEGLGMENFKNGTKRSGYWVRNEFVGSYKEYSKYFEE